MTVKVWLVMQSLVIELGKLYFHRLQRMKCKKVSVNFLNLTKEYWYNISKNPFQVWICILEKIQLRSFDLITQQTKEQANEHSTFNLLITIVTQIVN